MFGEYYSYDIPSATKNPLQDYLNLTDTQYNMIYTVYSIPNMLLPVFGGALVDLIGVNTTIIGFLVIIAVGQAFFAMGITVKFFPLVLAGRVIMGVGGESLGVAQSTLLASWFKGKEVAFAMGLNLSVSRMGSVINDYLSPYIYTNYSLPDVLWVGFVACVVSLLAAIFLVVIDKVKSRQYMSLSLPGSLNSTHNHSPSISYQNSQQLHESPSSQQFRNSSSSNRQRMNASSEYEQQQQHTSFSYSNNNSPSRSSIISHSDTDSDNDAEFDFRDILHFPLSFWILCCSIIGFYGSLLPFNNVASGILQDQYGLSIHKAGILLSIPFTISAIASPFLGAVIDRFGYKGVNILVTSIALTIAHTLFALGFSNPYVPLVLIGFSYALYAACVWPLIAVIMPSRLHGTAYGISFSMQNCGLALTPLLVGFITDVTNDWRAVELVFAALSIISTVSCLYLNITHPELNWRDISDDSEEVTVIHSDDSTPTSSHNYNQQSPLHRRDDKNV